MTFRKKNDLQNGDGFDELQTKLFRQQLGLIERIERELIRFAALDKTIKTN